MNTQVILSVAETLHRKAKRFDKLNIEGVKYLLTFDGHNYVVTREDGQDILAQGKSWSLNTRSVTQAKRWVREYILS